MTPAEILTSYFKCPGEYWEGIGWRQAKKLEDAIATAATNEGIESSDVTDIVVDAVYDRANSRPAPVYVVSVGGSGSHWLSNMLGELPGLCDGAEIYVPPPIMEQMEDLSIHQQAEVIDGIHLIHAWGRSGNWSETRVSAIVNTAHRPQLIDTFQSWDPKCTVIHLVRDPRDRALSVAYRKDEYRSQSAPGMDDQTYLRRKAKRNDTYLRRYMKSEHRADLEMRYEELKQDPARQLKAACSIIGIQVSFDAVQRAAFLHDADNIRAGAVQSKGNLDEGGKSRGWRSTASTRDRLLMHHILAYPVDVLRYQDDDCLARDAIDVIRRPSRRIPSDASALPVRVDISVAGEAWARMNGTTVPKDALVRIRPHDAFERSALQEAVELIRPDVLCLAGVRGLEGKTLPFLSGATGIVGVDIAGTGLSSDMKEVLQSLPDLRWLSATDTRLEEWACQRYRPFQRSAAGSTLSEQLRRTWSRFKTRLSGATEPP